MILLIRTLLLLVFVVFGAAGAGAKEPFADKLALPKMAATISLEKNSQGVAILEGDSRVRVGKFTDGKVTKWRKLEGTSGAKAIAGDETGLLLVISRDGGSYWLSTYRFGKRDTEPVYLAFEKPVGEISGISARSGILWVTFRNPSNILLLAYDGELLGRATDIDLLNSPFSIAIDMVGEGYVTDPLGPSIVRFSSSGVLQQVYDLKDTGIVRPTGIAVDDSGIIWISDGISGRIAQMETFGDTWDIYWPGNRRYSDPLRLGFDTFTMKGVMVVEGRIGRLRWLEEYR